MDNYNNIPSTRLLVSVYSKPMVRKLLDIKDTVNRPNNPEVHDIVETWIKYHYGNVNYDYCEVDDDEYEVIDENWNIENYR